MIYQPVQVVLDILKPFIFLENRHESLNFLKHLVVLLLHLKELDDLELVLFLEFTPGFSHFFRRIWLVLHFDRNFLVGRQRFHVKHIIVLICAKLQVSVEGIERVLSILSHSKFHLSLSEKQERCLVFDGIFADESFC